MKKAFSLVIASLIGSLSYATETVLLPYGQTTHEPWDALCFHASNSSGEAPAPDWYSLNFNDSQWAAFQGPLSDYTWNGLYYASRWEDNYSTYWVRRSFNIASLNSFHAFFVQAVHDDGAEIYLNGELIYSSSQVVSNTVTIELTPEQQGYLRTGKNVLAMRVSDTGGGDAFLDYGLTAYDEFPACAELRSALTALEARLAQGTGASSPKSKSEAQAFVTRTRKALADYEYNTEEAQWQTRVANRLLARLDYKYIDVKVQTPGTLGDLVLAKVENFTDVEAISISGALNDADITNLKDRMSNLHDIDMSQVEMSVMPDYLFSDHQQLQWMYLPESLTSIGYKSFYRCYSLFDIDFPAQLQTVRSNAFQECDSLQEVILPEGLNELQDHAFYSCDQVKKAYIPGSVTSIGNYAFYYNIRMKELELNEGTVNIGYESFYQCNQLKALHCPSTLRFIDSYAFEYCYALADVRLNEGLTRIGDNAFRDCDALTEITLPSTLMRADASPFDYCDNLRTVRCLSILPPKMDDQIPYGCDMADRVLYVPAISLNLYKQSTGWDKFQTILAGEELPDSWALWNEDRQPSRITVPATLPSNYRPAIRLENNDYYGDYTYRHHASIIATGEGALHARSLTIDMDWNAEYEDNDYSYWNYGSAHRYGYYFSTAISDVTFRTDSVHVTLDMPDNRWIFISLPFDLQVSDLVVQEGCDFVIHKYNGAARAQADFSSTWPLMTADSLLRAGEGYILQCSNPSGSWTRFNIDRTAVNATMLNKEDVVIGLRPFPASLNENRGWNLVANPYLCYYDTRMLSHRAPITVWDEYYKKYRVFSPIDDQYVLRPTEAFFLQCPADATTLTFDKEGRQSDRFVVERTSPEAKPAQANASRRTLYNLVIRQQEMTDQTRVVINAQASKGYEMECDASKMPAMDPQVPQLMTVEEGVALAINERPLSDGTVKLGTYLPQAGEAVIALESTTAEGGEPIILEDTYTGEKTDLTAGAYTYQAQRGTDSDRFILHIQGAATGLRTIEEQHQQGAATYYGLDGRRLEAPASQGLYLRQQGADVHKMIVK